MERMKMKMRMKEDEGTEVQRGNDVGVEETDVDSVAQAEMWELKGHLKIDESTKENHQLSVNENHCTAERNRGSQCKESVSLKHKCFEDDIITPRTRVKKDKPETHYHQLPSQTKESTEDGPSIEETEQKCEEPKPEEVKAKDDVSQPMEDHLKVSPVSGSTENAVVVAGKQDVPCSKEVSVTEASEQMKRLNTAKKIRRLPNLVRAPVNPPAPPNNQEAGNVLSRRQQPQAKPLVKKQKQVRANPVMNGRREKKLESKPKVVVKKVVPGLERGAILRQKKVFGKTEQKREGKLAQNNRRMEKPQRAVRKPRPSSVPYKRSSQRPTNAFDPNKPLPRYAQATQSYHLKAISKRTTNDSSQHSGSQKSSPSSHRLRSSSSSNVRAYNVPPHISKGQKDDTVALTQPYSPFLQTKQRFRAVKAQSSRLQVEAQQECVKSKYTGQPTEPASMKLETRVRSKLAMLGGARSRLPLSQEEREIEFMKRVKPFKARQLNQKVMQSNGGIGLPKVAKKPVTRCHEFKFRTSRRATLHASHFSSRENVTSRSEVGHRKAFQSSRQKVANATEEVPFRRSILRHIQEQNLVARRRREQRLEEEEKRAFKANPLPDFSHRQQFTKAAQKPVTVAMTPKTLIRSRLSAELFEKKLLNKRIRDVSKSHFVASGLPETTYTPERLQHPVPKGPTVASTPDLRTDTRAVEREAFEIKLKDKEIRQEMKKDFEARQEELRRRREMKDYRRTLIHKALPLPYHVRQVHLEKAPTMPDVKVGAVPSNQLTDALGNRTGVAPVSENEEKTCMASVGYMSMQSMQSIQGLQTKSAEV